MYLTKEEERILDGELGNIKAKAMRILATLGDIFNADKLIPIQSTQISGISYKTIGDAGMNFLEDWSDASVVVESRMNPAGMDLENWKQMGVPKEFAKKQLRIVNALTSMGVKKSCTCAPYEAGLVPKRGTHIAWSESSAVSFANSVLGAMTNREGGPSALSASLIGKTPNYGYHLVENRLGEIKFKVNFDLNDLDFSLLGYHIGKIAQNRIPVIEGIKKANREQLKSLGAGAAASGGVGMFMVKHITSEYRERDNIEVLNVHQSDLENIVNQFANCSSYDVIAFGCPHSSFKEIKQIIDNVKTTKEIWICTAREIKERTLKELKSIPKNVKILADTCMVVAPVKEIGIDCIATNSTKCAHYSQNLSRIKTLLKSKEDLLNET